MQHRSPIDNLQYFTLQKLHAHNAGYADTVCVVTSLSCANRR